MGFLKHAFVLSFFFLIMASKQGATTVGTKDESIFVRALRCVNALGGDTDTNACIVCGMLGALLGIKQLPMKMLHKVLEFDSKKQHVVDGIELGHRRPDWTQPLYMHKKVSELLSYCPSKLEVIIRNIDE